MTKKTLTAEQRGQELFKKKWGEMPYLAVDYVRNVANRIGCCNDEVVLTTFTIYAQLVEGLKCTNELYIPNPEKKEQFRDMLVALKKEGRKDAAKALARLDSATTKVSHQLIFRKPPNIHGQKTKA